jgi:DNA invertase Pin-like site-specific DNA recombinase
VRASIYCRISRDRVGAGLGVATQEADCRALAQRLGHSIVSVHTDNDLSAYSGKPRPGYRALLGEIRAGLTDVVIAWHTDRLHRSPVELEDYVIACETHGVITHTVKAGEMDLSSASGLMVARILGATARHEVDHMIERQQRAKLRSAEAGKWNGGRRPYGYEADGVTVRQDEADAIREATTALLAGASIRGLVRQWNATGRRTTAGNKWANKSLRTTLLRVRNAGLMQHRGEIIGKAEWPAIVPESQWRALVELLNNPGRRTNVANMTRRWLGSGLYRCECGSPLTSSSTRRGPAYRCRDGCGRLSRKQDGVDDFVSAVIVGRLRRPDLADLLHRDDEGQLSRLEAESVSLRSRLDSLAGLFGQGVIDAQQLTEGSREIKRRLEEVREETAALYHGTALAGVADAEDPGAAWLGAPLDRQRAVLDALATVTLLLGGQGRPAGWQVGESYFRPELVKIEWRGGDATKN